MKNTSRRRIYTKSQAGRIKMFDTGHGLQLFRCLFDKTFSNTNNASFERCSKMHLDMRTWGT